MLCDSYVCFKTKLQKNVKPRRSPTERARSFCQVIDSIERGRDTRPGCYRPSSAHERSTASARVNNKTLRGSSDIVKRVAGYKCQLWFCGLAQNPDVTRFDDFDGVHRILKVALSCCQLNDVIGANFSKRTKERIAMSGNGHVADSSRKRGTFNMACGNVQDGRM